MSQKSKITFGIFEEKRLENDLSSAMKEAERVMKEGGSIEEMRNAGRDLADASRALDSWDQKHGHSHQNLQGESSRLSMNLGGMISGKEHAEEQRLETAFSSAMKEARRLVKEGGSIEEMQNAGKALMNAGQALNEWDRKHGHGHEDNYHGHQDLQTGAPQLSFQLGSMVYSKERPEEQKLENNLSSAMKEARLVIRDGGSVEEMQQADKNLLGAVEALNSWDQKHGAKPGDNYHGHENLKNGFSELSLNLGSMISRQQSQKPSLPGAPGAGRAGGTGV